MSRVSATSGRLGQFVRRVRTNALELQTVGSTQLERQIQSLFGGAQIENLPQSLQQIIAQDRALGGGGGSGPLTINNPFTNEELTPDQQKAAANQIAIQQGANPPFPEVQQPQGQNSVVESARQASSNLQPLVQQGLLSQRDASGIVRSIALDNTLDANEQRKAAKDVKAASQQFRSGQISQQQLATTMESLRSEHSKQSLNLIPEWRELTGTEGQFQTQVAEAVKAKAASFGLPSDAFRFDSKTGAIVPNQEWFEIDSFKTKKDTEVAKPALALADAQRKSASNNLQLRLRGLEKNFQADSKIDPKVAAERYNIALGEVNTQFISELPETAGAAARPVSVPDQTSASTPGLPAGVQLFGAFPDINALRKANPPPSSYFTVGGALGRRRADGHYEAVQ